MTQPRKLGNNALEDATRAAEEVQSANRALRKILDNQDMTLDELYYQLARATQAHGEALQRLVRLGARIKLD